MRFRLHAKRCGYLFIQGKFVRDAGRYHSLPLEPYDFVPTEGTAIAIGLLASAYNNQQTDAGHLDYLYSAEPIPDSEGVPA